MFNRNKLWIAAAILMPALIFANGMNLNGVGSKAIGMGGAFVGLADDYSAVFWNPAGISQIKGTSVSLFFTDVIPSGTYKFDMYQVDAKTVANHYISGAFGVFFDLGSKLKAGVFANVPSGLGAEWDGAELLAFSGNTGTEFNWMSKLGVFNFGPVLAYRVSEKISVGATLNFAYGMMDMDRPVDADGDGVMDVQYKEESTGTGMGLTIGALIKASEQFSFGLSFRTEHTVKFSGSAENPMFAAYNAPIESDFDRDITWPIWVGGGIAFKPNEKLTLTADVQWTQWETVDVLVTEYKNAFWAAALEPIQGDELEMLWESTMQIRIGGQYRVSDNLFLRLGYYNDPTPGPDKTANIILPQIDYNVVTLGAGWTNGMLQVDFSLEYLMGSERDIAPAMDSRMPGLHNMNMIVPNIALSYFLN